MSHLREHFENSPEDKKIIEEIGHKDLSDYTDEELTAELKQLESQAHAVDINSTMTPTEQIKDTNKRLAQVNLEISRRKTDNPS